MSILNPAPRAVLEGVKDLSSRAQPSLVKKIPTNCFHFYLFTEKGPTAPEFVDANDFSKLYGNRSTDIRGKFFTHGTLGYNTVASQGNLCLIQRLKPTDANPPAGLALWLEILAEDIPQYARGPNGAILLNNNGEKTPLTNAGQPVTTPGYSGRWVVAPLQRVNGSGQVITQSMIDQYEAGNLTIDITPVANRLGTLTPRTGTRSNAAGPSTMYPILELETSDFGSVGNRSGVKLWAAKTTDSTPVDSSLVSDNSSFLYRMQVVYKDDDLSSPVTQPTLRGGQYVEFSFKEGAINRKFGSELWADYLLTDSYNSNNLPNVTQVRGNFSKHHVYYDNIREVSELILTSEATANAAVVGTPENAFLINLFDATDVDGAEYFSYTIVGPSGNGLYLDSYKTHWAVGGSDGTMTNTTYDQLVGHELANYGLLEAKMLDALRYPVTTYLDTGFSLDTKKKLISVISKRKDVLALACTFVSGQAPFTPEQEDSMAIALSAFARTQPESTQFGTPVVRAGIYGHSGRLLNSAYLKPVPWILDVATKIAKYMGSGDKIWKSEFSFDNDRNNRVTTMHDINITYKPELQRVRDWDLGLTTVQYADESTLFAPGWPTCYPDSTSNLNNIIHAYVVCELEKICMRAWTKLTFNSKLTNKQFIEKSNKAISDELKDNRFDGHVTVVPDTFISPDDSDRGFSYSCKLNMYSGVAKTVGSYHIVSRRLEDLNVGGNA